MEIKIVGILIKNKPLQQVIANFCNMPQCLKLLTLSLFYLLFISPPNYYFEIDKQDEWRKKGPSKENRKDPIVQMGLLLDKCSLPILYKLFPGNTHDSQTLMPMLTEIKKTFGVKRLIVVADKALNSGDNIAYNTILKDGYIYSKSVRGASEEFKSWVLDKGEYRQLSDQYKLKSKLVPDVAVHVTVGQKGKRKIKKTVRQAQKWVVFYSEKYAVRAKYKREETIAKALDTLQRPKFIRCSYMAISLDCLFHFRHLQFFGLT